MIDMCSVYLRYHLPALHLIHYQSVQFSFLILVFRAMEAGRENTLMDKVRRIAKEREMKY